MLRKSAIFKVEKQNPFTSLPVEDKNNIMSLKDLLRLSFLAKKPNWEFGFKEIISEERQNIDVAVTPLVKELWIS